MKSIRKRWKKALAVLSSVALITSIFSSFGNTKIEADGIHIQDTNYYNFTMGGEVHKGSRQNIVGSGQAVFCLENGVPVDPTSPYEEVSLENMASATGVNPYTLKHICRIIYIGYTGKPNPTTGDQDATQLAVWRAMKFGTISDYPISVSEDPNTLELKALYWPLSPRLTGGDYDDKTKSFTLNAGESVTLQLDKYSTDIEDLSECKLVDPPQGLTLTATQDSLTFTADDTFKGANKLYIQKHSGELGGSQAYFYSPSYGTSQRCMMAYGIDPVDFMLKPKTAPTEETTLKIRKIDAVTQGLITESDGTYAILTDKYVRLRFKKTATGLVYAADGDVSEFQTKQGELEIKGLPAGSYLIREVTPPTGYTNQYLALEKPEGDDTPFEIKAKDSTNVDIQNRKGCELKIRKIDADTHEVITTGEATFSILNPEKLRMRFKKEGNAYYYVRDGQSAVEFSTNDGEILFKGIPEGYDYSIVEAKSPDGYEGLKEPLKFTVNSKTLTTIDVENKFKAGRIEVTKKLDDGTLVTIPVGFTLYKANENGEATGEAIALEKLADGSYTLNRKDASKNTATELFTHEGKLNVENLPLAKYVFKETTIPDGVYVDPNSNGYVVDLKEGTTSENFENTKQQYRLKIVKTDEATGKSLPIAGLQFQIYKTETGGDPLSFDGKTEFLTDANGEIVIENVTYGTYYLQELKGANGYYLDPNAKRLVISIEKAPSNKQNILTVEKVPNKAQVGRVEFTKFGDKLLRFETSTYEANVRGEEGEVSLNLRQAVTIPAETPESPDAAMQPTPDTEPQSDTAPPTSNSDGAGEVVENRPSDGLPEAVQPETNTDDATAEPRPASNMSRSANEAQTILIKYDILNNAGEVVKTDILPDFEGNITVNLPVGTYTVVEKNVPEAYRQVYAPFTVDAGFTKKQYTLATPVYKEQGLAGATYRLVAAEDIYDLPYQSIENGVPVYPKTASIVYHAGDEIGQYTTNESGKFFVPDMNLGSYYFEEVEAPKGFKLSTQKIPFTLSPTIPSVAIVNTSLRAIDENQEIKVKFKKTFEEAKWHDYHEIDPLLTIFGLFYKDPVEIAGLNFNETTLLGVAKPVRNAEGIYEVSFDLPVDGTFVIRELSSGEAYNLADDRYFTVDYQPTQAESIHVDEKEVENTLIRSSVKLVKIDSETKEPISGVKFALFVNKGGDEAEFVDTFTTDEKGEIEVHDLEKGDYFFKEVVPADGYYVKDDQTDIKIVKDGEMIVFTRENDKTKTEFSKVDATTGAELPGAKLTVFDKDGKIVDTWTSTDKPHKIRGLKVGETYTLYEDLSPLGYAKASEVKFKVNEDGQIDKVVMKDEIIKIDFSKVDVTTGTELPGAKLTLYDKDKNVVETWTSTDKPHRIEGLHAGETYTLHEDLAPLGYKLSSDIEFKVSNTGQVQRVVMVDEPTGVVIKKTDVTTGKVVPNATIIIYDEEGKEVYKDVTNENGIIHAAKLPVGKYTFKEVVAPYGYVLNQETFNFEIKPDGTVEGVCDFVDEPTALKILKVNEKDAALEGIQFQIKNSEGEIFKFQNTERGFIASATGDLEFVTTDSKGAASVLYLPKGKYSLIELNPPKGYQALTLEFDLTDDTKVSTPLDLKVVNKPIPIVPQTGDRSLAIILASVLVVVMGAGFILISLKKSKR